MKRKRRISCPSPEAFWRRAVYRNSAGNHDCSIGIPAFVIVDFHICGHASQRKPEERYESCRHETENNCRRPSVPRRFAKMELFGVRRTRAPILLAARIQYL